MLYLSKKDIKFSRFLKFELTGSNFLFSALFILMAEFLTSNFYIIFFKTSLPFIMAIIFNLFRFIVFSILMDIYFYALRKEKYSFHVTTWINSLIITISTWAFVFGMHAIFGIISAALASLLTQWIMDSTLKAILLTTGYTLLGFFVASIIVSFVMLYYCMQVKNKSYKDIIKVYLIIIRSLMTKPIFFTSINLIIVIYLYAGAYLQTGFGLLTGWLIPYSFLQIFFQMAFSTVINIYLLNILFQSAKVLILERKDEALTQAMGRNPIPISLVIAAVPIMLSLIVFPIQGLNVHNRVLKEIEHRIATGDILVQSGLIDEAVWEYSVAQSLLEGLKGYYNNILAINDEDEKYQEKAEIAFKKGLELFPANSYIPLFKANLARLNEEEEEALKLYKKAVTVPNFQPESMVCGYETAMMVKDREAGMQMLDWMIYNEVYSQEFLSYTEISEKNLEKLLDSLNELEEEIGPKQMYHAVLLSDMGEYQNAEKELNDLLEKYPKDPEIHYYLSKLYNEYRHEQSEYDKVVSHAEKFAKYYEPKNQEEENEELIFLAESYVSANMPDKGLEVYKELYENNKSDYIIAQKYAYSLIMNKDYEEALKILEKIEYNESENRNEKIYLTAMALLNLGRYDESLEAFVQLDEYKDDFIRDYDRYLYSYSLAYANAATDNSIIEITTKYEDSLVYPYIMAMEAWSRKDNATAYSYMEKVLDEQPDLGFALYAQGINAYENTVRTGSEDFSEAIELYNDATQYIPDHVELYFSMGHAYKKAGNYKGALRSFRYSLILLPFEDHRTDPFGITVHAQGEVTELNRLLKEEGGN